MNQLRQLVNRWIMAEADADADVEMRARAVLQALPSPVPSRDLVAWVMASLAPTSLWARRPVRYLVMAALVILGLGIPLLVLAAPALTAIAGLALWRELASHLLVVGIEFGTDVLAAADTVWNALADTQAAADFFRVAPWVAVGLFVVGTSAMTRLSLWRDKENWNHA